MAFSSSDDNTLNLYISVISLPINLKIEYNRALYFFDCLTIKLENNPNSSDFNTIIPCDKTGRHLVTVQHIERYTFPWNWANYPADRNYKVSPWLEAFMNARLWIEKR